MLKDWIYLLIDKHFLHFSRVNESSTSSDDAVDSVGPAGFVPPYPHHVPYSPWNSHQLPDIQTR